MSKDVSGPLLACLQELHLPAVRAQYEAVARQASAEGWGYADYLRELLDQTGVRTFTVFVEPLVGVKTNLRNYGDNYAVVISPSREVPLEDMRHGYLHFLLDPIPYRHRRAVERLRPLLTYAGRAPRFPAEYREQFPSFVVECLVRAVPRGVARESSVATGKVTGTTVPDNNARYFSPPRSKVSGRLAAHDSTEMLVLFVNSARSKFLTRAASSSSGCA